MDDHCIHKVHAIFRAVIEFERALEDTFNMNINELMLLCMLANRKPSRRRNSLRDGAYTLQCIESNRRTRTERIPETPDLQTRQPVPAVQHNRKRTEADGTHQLQIVPHTTRPRRHHCTGMMRTTPGTTRPRQPSAYQRNTRETSANLKNHTPITRENYAKLPEKWQFLPSFILINE